MNTTSIDAPEVATRVHEILNRRPTPGLAVAVVQNGASERFFVHGLADIGTNTPITEDTVFRIASISKTFTAIAVMQLWERGLVDLDAAANDYLRAFKLIPASPAHRPATVRHLLTHTSGIGEERGLRDLLRPTLGSEVTTGPARPLAEHYGGGLRVATEPGTRYAYTDHGFATLGQIVEDVSGEPFARYLRDHVFRPLGMEATDTVHESVRPLRATGYVLRSRGLRPVREREFALGGAGFVYSSTRDMARYAAALLGGGENDHGAVLKPETLAAMFEPHYQPDPRIPGMGLAFFRAGEGSRPMIEHGGILPGFTSQLFLAPDDGIGVVAFANMGSPAPLWLPWETQCLLHSLLGIADDAIRTDVPHRPEIWADLCGHYGAPGPITDVRTRAMVAAGAQVVVRRGRLTLRVLGPIPSLLKGLHLHPDDPDDPYVFRIDLARFGLGTARVVFSQRTGAQTTALHFDLVPLTLPKRTERATRFIRALDPPDDFNFRHFRARHMVAELLRTGLPPGESAPDVDLPTTDGGRVRLSDLRGRPVLLHFVSYTCPVTRGGIHTMRELHRLYGENVHFVEVLARQAHPGERHGPYDSQEQKRNDGRDYADEENTPWTVAIDDLYGTVQRAYGGLAAGVYLIDAGGNIAFCGVWGQAPALRQAIDDLLARGGSGTPAGQGTDRRPHLAAAIVAGQSGPLRGGRRSLIDLELGFPGALLLMGVGRVARPVLTPLALRTTPLPPRARAALLAGAVAVTSAAVLGGKRRPRGELR